MIVLEQIFKNYRQKIFNVILFVILGQYIYRETRIYDIFINLKFIDITFFIHNILIVFIVLFRREYKILDMNPFHWIISVISFFSNLFFLKSNLSSGKIIIAADYLNLFAVIFGIVTLINLGRSFGIIPALREVRTGGVYRLIRHPMYVSDFLFKLPVVLKYFSVYNIIILVLSVALYIMRASFEEKLLMNSENYRSYAAKVKYRFIPLLY